MSDQPPSADALRASESSLVARAEARQSTFGRAWEQVARLMLAVRDGRDPQQIDVRVQWADAATRSVAQEADAVVKLHQAGLLPASYALAKLGYSDDEITKIRTARTYSDAIGESTLTEGWTRGLDADPCQLCRWWWREGRVWPKAHRMPTHPGCACVPRPVWATNIRQTLYTRRLERNSA